MAHESRDDRNQGSDEDDEATSPADEVTTGNPYHLSRGTRTLLRLVSVILALSMTALFLRGFIHT